MTIRSISFAVLILALTAASAAAAEGLHFDGRIKVGGTGIMCVKEPCPRIGLMAAGEPGKPRIGRPMFAGAEPPPMKGAAPDLEAVRAAWTREACLIVEGRFSRPPLLAIRRVVGPCGPHD